MQMANLDPIVLPVNNASNQIDRLAAAAGPRLGQNLKLAVVVDLVCGSEDAMMVNTRGVDDGGVRADLNIET